MLIAQGITWKQLPRSDVEKVKTEPEEFEDEEFKEDKKELVPLPSPWSFNALMSSLNSSSYFSSRSLSSSLE
jgi:hypothetical protein